MNSHAQAAPESQMLLHREVSIFQQMYWAVTREIWENRAIYFAPLLAAVIALVAFLVRMSHLPHRLQALRAQDAMRMHAPVEQPYTFAALLIMFATFVVAIFYSLDALYGERRDRSILFWKSLPVSDLTTVLAKASIPLVILPLLTFVTTVATHGVMLLIESVSLAGTGISITGRLSPLSMWGMLLYHLVAIHGLWYAPFYGWLLMVSAWARRAPIVWAVLPPLAIGIFEKIAFNTGHFASLLRWRIFGGPTDLAPVDGPMSMHSLMPTTVGHFLSSPGLWNGLALTALFLAAAVWLRRERGPA